MNKVYEYILNEYGYDEPVFTKNLKAALINEMSYDTLRQNLKRLADEGLLIRVDRGTYYIPRKTSVLKTPRVNFNKVVYRKYIQPNNEQIIGYTCGINFANQLGATTQTATISTIVTNETGRPNEEVKKVGNVIIKLKKSKVEVNKNNYKFLQILDLLNDYEKISEEPLNNRIYINILKYLEDTYLTQKEYYECLLKYPKKTIAKAVELGLENAITQR